MSSRTRRRALLAVVAVATIGVTRLAFAATLFTDDFADGNTSSSTPTPAPVPP